MAEVVQSAQLVRATQVAHDAEVRRAKNGVQFATFGETGLEAMGVDVLDRILETVPTQMAAALKANTYYFVPLALREVSELDSPLAKKGEPAMVAEAYTEAFGDAAICHRNVELGSGHRGVFISTRLMGDRFALSFEFFINVAHAFVDVAGVPEAFAELAWQQALANVKGETSMDAWESRNLATGRSLDATREPAASSSRRRNTRPLSLNASADVAPVVIDEKERALFVETAFSDAVAIYLLSLALDFDYSELREREYPLLAPNALAARLRMVAEMFPPNAGYEFAVRYRRRA